MFWARLAWLEAEPESATPAPVPTAADLSGATQMSVADFAASFGRF